MNTEHPIGSDPYDENHTDTIIPNNFVFIWSELNEEKV
jgi:hypothetical protein